MPRLARTPRCKGSGWKTAMATLAGRQFALMPDTEALGHSETSVLAAILTALAEIGVQEAEIQILQAADFD
jgi:hypothetical protein